MRVASPSPNDSLYPDPEPRSTVRVHRTVEERPRTSAQARVARHLLKRLRAPDSPLTIRRAREPRELETAYRLVHDVFVEQGYLRAEPDGLRLRVYELNPDMATFIAKAEERIVGVLSVVLDSSELGLPSDKVFGAELDALRRGARTIAEITNLAVDPAYRGTNLFLELARCASTHLLARRVDRAFVAVSRAHGAVFESVLCFRPCGEARSYSTDLVDIVEGLAWDASAFEAELSALDAQLLVRPGLHAWFFDENPRAKEELRECRDAESAFFAADVPRALLARAPHIAACLARSDRAALESLWARRAPRGWSPPWKPTRWHLRDRRVPPSDFPRSAA